MTATAARMIATFPGRWRAGASSAQAITGRASVMVHEPPGAPTRPGARAALPDGF